MKDKNWDSFVDRFESLAHYQGIKMLMTNLPPLAERLQKARREIARKHTLFCNTKCATKFATDKIKRD